MYFKTTLLFLFGLVCAQLSFAQSLSGFYTIGGVNPDYVNLSSASAALNVNGVSGPVTFFIRSGTYSEQFTLNQIAGVSSVNTILFTSESGDSTDVIIQHIHTSASLNYTVFLNGTDYITFSHITIRVLPPTTGTPYEVVLKATGSCSNITIKNCRIESFNVASSVTESAITLFGPTGQTDFDSVRVLNNYFYKGRNGIYITGEPTGASEYRVLKGNVFYDQAQGGITISEGKNNIIEDNQFLRISFNPALYSGIFLNANHGYAHIRRNYFDLVGNSKSFVTGNSVNNISGETIFANNIIRQTNTVANSNIQGLRIDGCPTLKLLNNTIEITTTPGNSSNSCISLSGIDTAYVLNNIFSYNGRGFVYILNTLDSLYFDYNDVFKNSSDSIARINFSVVSNLTYLQNYFGLETNSYSVDPILIGNYNHIPINLACYNNGYPIAEVPTDFFGTPRSITTPDIGAYEGDPPAVEVGFLNNNLSVYGNCVLDTADVFIQVSNFGTDTITQMNIHVGSSVIPWVGVIAPGTLLDSILVAQVVIQNSSSISLSPIWLSLPNGIQDDFALNDTVHVVIYPAMSGIYTVGNSSADYLSLKVAADQMNNAGICGPVIFNILDGIYDEQVIFNSINGTSSVNTITIQSVSQDSSLVTLKYTTSAGLVLTKPVISIQNVDHISILHLGFDAPISTSSRFIEITGKCDSVEFSNCSFQKIEVRYKSLSAIQNKGFFIKNNRFLNSVNQVSVEGNIVSQVEDVKIQNNVFSANINPKFLNIKHAKNVLVEKNKYTGLGSVNTFVLDTCSGPIWIKSNSFNLVNQSNPVRFSNLIGDSSNGIYITNNMINNSLNSVEITKSKYLYFYHNTLKSTLIFGGNNTNVFVKNNIMSSVKYNTLGDVNSVVIDYNGLTTAGSNHVNIGSNGMTITTFQSFYQQQFNSLTLPANFVSASDLHLYNAYNYDNTGTPLPFTSLDIDGELRSSISPDMGADEFEMDFSVILDNIRLNKIIKPDTNVCVLQDSMIIQIVNNSDTIVDSVLIKAKLFGTTIDSFYVNQTMNPSDTIDVFVGEYDFNVNTQYDLDFSVTLPNGIIDQYPVDNTAKLSYSFIDNCKIYSKPIDDCLTDIQLYIKDFPRHSILWSTGEITPRIVVSSPGIYSVTVVFNNGCVVSDSFTVN